MAKNQKAKTSKGERNDARKNGKAFKKPRPPKATKKTWEQRCEERRIRRAAKNRAA